MSFAASGLSKRFVVAEEKKGCVMTKLGALPILVPVLILALAFLAHAQQPEIVAGGESEYQRACVVCHGIDGRGDGIMRQYLKIPPANLRQLAKNNGGKFPFWEVYAKLMGNAKFEVMERVKCRYGASVFGRSLGVMQNPH